MEMQNITSLPKMQTLYTLYMHNTHDEGLGRTVLTKHTHTHSLVSPHTSHTAV